VIKGTGGTGLAGVQRTNMKRCLISIYIMVAIVTFGHAWHRYYGQDAMASQRKA